MPLLLTLGTSLLLVLSTSLSGTASSPPSSTAAALDPSNPTSAVKLVFIHHSTGENWLNDENGALGIALRNANYFVSDTNYGWGPFDTESGSGPIGDHTDVGNYFTWFLGPNRDTYFAALYGESGQNSSYSRLAADPGGVNQIVMYKSCFPNSNLSGSETDPVPSISENPLRNRDAGSEFHTFASVKGIYQALHTYFATRQDSLFVLVTSPPLMQADTSPEAAGLARKLSNWLVSEWLADYPHRNVFVFDLYNVLTSNGGSTRTNDPHTSDLDWADGNHHRYREAALEHVASVPNNFSAYPSGDSHPSQAGNLKATGEFRQLLNIAYHCWQGTGGCPTYATSSCAVSCSATVPANAAAGASVSFGGSATLTGCAGAASYDWDYGDSTAHGTAQNATHVYGAAGSYPWSLTVTADGQSCTRTGTIAVSGGGPASCSPDAMTLCLNGSRFRVQATWRDYAGRTGAAYATPMTSDTGYFWFSGATNVEIVIKVLDFCSVSGSWAVYAAGLTDLGVSLAVTDTSSGTTKTYPNTLGTPFVLVRDGAFSCP